jgi:hypothetical protein
MSAPGRLRRRARQRTLGQSLVETALIVPAMVTLAAGCGQVGVIAYGAASVETSARSAARVASEYPGKSLDFVGRLGISTYTCGQTPADQATEDSVCSAARSAAGLLSGAALTITVTVTSAISGLPPPDDVVRTANYCPGGALETGTVARLPSATVATISSPAKASAATVVSDSLGRYSICLSAPGPDQEGESTTITATAVDASGCTYHSTVAVTVSTRNTVSPSPANITLPTAGTCPTPQPRATGTPTPAPTATPLVPTPAIPTPTAAPWLPTASPTPPPATACATAVSDTSYVRVTVSYQAPVFVPLIGRYFENPAGSGGRTVQASQRMQVEPCTITQGG